ncbi:transcriptional regulator, MarR family [Marvinbryantia formatexigens DSM 14469]|uniref:HTH-type transcriptional regulator SarZ n=1 Tax=Marvinbryantia formatexigens DSM 14469 TaxID=478749 RepID=C6L9F9_9FIRM|nr:MarR family winged helix-turn-helix transcriptional regulator [Marvinbryantia formatexigens]EET62898.1 transcriptional regulator, MarR family [Marvinbryantia formatexigens DSM 14469]UWO23494.1 MarR family winged helix-turn-helix transcriptional regulator [Marvinbryantia formatexigens DSM 14469]SDG56486.1 DNA-binding transcriptional regulator, MarR family [Marvinbryantia formatexigens]
MYSLQETICFKLMLIRDRVHEYAKPYFREIGITYGNYVTMLFLYENPGITQARLAELNHKDRNVIVQTIDKLEEKNYVKRVRAKHDRRAYTLYLTEQGEEVIRKYWNVVTDAEKNLSADISEEELTVFRSVIEKMCEEKEL